MSVVPKEKNIIGKKEIKLLNVSSNILTEKKNEMNDTVHAKRKMIEMKKKKRKLTSAEREQKALAIWLFLELEKLLFLDLLS
jgi:asparagine synthetase A